ncbi:hypothetical protein [Leisingera sp. ANG-M6]|uniref:hypothetical protein n=1 Tax=Leisingera sp. ANG-M6 TaxID=1577900 RepID=UPI00057E19E4|nr:hypothetical protein [Leisingera sp. ANG-M6]KIC27816.1 hypothetical protein RA24_14090 [Leisingera sp. ANG-M6]
MEHELNRSKVIDFVEARNRHQLNRKRLEVDVERYQDYLDGSGISDEQKADFLKALWTVIVAFVDIGYGVHPVQTGEAEVISLHTHQPRCRNESPDFGGAANV